jgi:hypothetical protein
MPTLLDIATLNGCDATRGLIEEVVRVSPEVDQGYADTIPGLNVPSQVRTSLPTVNFRGGNEGSPRSASTYEKRLFECFIMNPVWTVDKAVADAHVRGAQAFIAMEGIGMLEAAMIALSTQFYYGGYTSLGGDAKGHPGVRACVDSSMTIDAGYSGSSGSTIWAVRWGMMDTAWLYGLNGQLALSAVKEIVTADPNDATKILTQYHQEILTRPGLQVGSKWSVACVKNVSVDAADTTHRANDKLLGQLKTLFPDSKRPHMYFMTKEVREHLRESRTATNPTGTPAPTPTDFEGIPILATQGLVNTETNW